MNNNNFESSCFDISCSSTPQNEIPVLGSCRKRKASCIDKPTQNVSDVMDCYSPQFSSTLNESLMNHLETFHFDSENVSTNKAQTLTKQWESTENRKYFSVPNTPEHQVKHSQESITRKANTNSVVKTFSQLGMLSQSPLNKEVYDILYPEIPLLDQLKKPATPIKADKSSTQAKKRLFYRQNPLKQILSNSVIMNKILKHLSNGDLYRLAKVSNGFKDSILRDFEAYPRFSDYTNSYRHHKENYRITPPSSPEKDTEIETEISSGSSNFEYFYQFTKVLNKYQSLIKCPKCQKASIVENYIGQCQEINKCGYIFCKKCDSFATNPRDFKDKCNNAQLLNSAKPRNLFGDLSNSTTSDYMTDNSSSFFSSSLSSSSCKYDSSGIFSDCEKSTPKRNVKRNLTKSFTSPLDVKIFSSNARVYTPLPQKQPRRASLVPVVAMRATHAPVSDVMDPPSPPSVKEYSACSKLSRKSLKRSSR